MAWRFLRSRKLRAFLTAMGVALGVAMIAALTVLGAGLQRAITEQLRQGFGTYDVMAGYHGGRLLTLKEQELLRRTPDLTYSVGVLYLEPANEQHRLAYIGMDRFPEGQFGYPLKAGRYPGAAEFATEERVAADLGLKLGESITLPFRTGPQTVTLVGLMRSAASGTSALMMDLTWLQGASGLQDQTTLMLFGVRSLDAKDRVGANMLAALPELDVQLRKELDDVQRNMAGLKPMAVVFGVAGLFAAIFLVAGSFAIAVQERTRELALLRAVGAVPGQVVRLVLQEAALLGALGGVAGVALGVLGAGAAMGAAANSLGVSDDGLVLPWTWLLIEAAGGALLAVLAAWRPARAAGAIPPLQAMRPDAAGEAREERVGGQLGLILMGISILAMAGALALPADGSGLRPLVGALSGLLFTAGLITAQVRVLPWVVGAISRPLALLSPAVALLAGRAVLRHRRRSAMTAATLILGIMLTTSVGTFFRQLITNGEAYTRSQFFAEAVVEAGLRGDLGSSLPEQVTAVDGVTQVVATGAKKQALLTGWDFSKADPRWSDEMRHLEPAYGSDPRSLMLLLAVDLAAASRMYDFGRVEGSVSGEAGVVISALQAKRWGIRLGDTLRYRLFDGFDHGRPVLTEVPAVKVVAIVERSAFRWQEVLVSRSLLPPQPDGAVHFKYDHARRDEVLTAVRSLLGGRAYGTATLRDMSGLLEEERQMANQRMAIFAAVALVIFLVAAFGLFNSMMTGLQQRLRELGTLRAAGATPWQMSGQVLAEALIIGLAGTVLGAVAGVIFTTAVAIGVAGPIGLRHGLAFYVGSLVAGPLLAAIAGLIPALRAAGNHAYKSE